MPIAALVIGDAVLGAEVRAGTFHFTWLSPTPIWQIVLGRWLGGSLVALVTIAPACALAAVVAGAPSSIGPIALAAAVGAVAYVAVFIAIGCLTRRTAVWSLAFVFLVERLLGAALTGIAQLSPTWESRAIFVGLLDDPPRRLVREGIPAGGGAVVRLLIVTAVALGSPPGGCATSACPAPPTDLSRLLADGGRGGHCSGRVRSRGRRTGVERRVTFRTVIIGGDAAGMSAATRVRGLRPDAEVVVLEKSRFTSYSACGIPFLVGGLVSGGVDRLVARTPEQHRERGIDVRIHHEATAIDVDAGEVEFLDEHAGTIERIGYDELLIATGGEAIRPDLPGVDLPFIHGVQSLDDAQSLLSLANEGCRRIVVVGGGYIGLEMAEAYIERGCTATIIERSAQPMGLLDADFGERVADALRGHGVDVRCDVDVEGFEPGAVLTSDGPVDADLVILGIGVRPRSELAAAAGHRARPQGRHPRRRAPAHVGGRRLVGRRLRHGDPA